MDGRPSPGTEILTSASPLAAVEAPATLDLRYPGGKGLAGLQQWICANLPPHVYYVEPFAGKCGVFRAKTPALHSTLIDRDTETLAWLHRHIERWDPREKAEEPGGLRLSANKSGGQRSHIASPDDFGSSIDGGDDCRGHRQERRGSSHIRIVQGCGIEFMERAADEGCEAETLFYCDPPYHLSTRVKLKLYRYEMSDRDHRRFLRAACRLRCAVVISGYACDLYADRLKGWKFQTRQVITRGGTLATECLWSNQPAAEASAFGMTYDQLGTSFRERERVARLVKRWGADFAKRPARERRAILLALLNAEAGLVGR